MPHESDIMPQNPDSLREILRAKLDGFRVYKIRSRGDEYGDRKYIAPVYVIGLPGDVDLFNKQMENELK